MFLNNQQVTEEIKREIKKFLETNDKENMITQNLWDAAKAVLRGVVILRPPKIKSATVVTVAPSICHEVMGPDAMILVF